MQLIQYNKMTIANKKMLPISYFYIKTISKNKDTQTVSYFYIKKYKDAKCLLRDNSNVFLNIRIPTNIKIHEK